MNRRGSGGGMQKACPIPAYNTFICNSSVTAPRLPKLARVAALSPSACHTVPIWIILG